MLRLIIFLLLLYVAYRLIRLMLGGKKRPDRPSYAGGPRQINEMVQDPVCKVYVPKKEALYLEHAGAGYYFCSRTCREEFLRKIESGGTSV